MPKIPEYYSRGNIPAESMPRIPADAGGQVGAALARGGAQIAEVGLKIDEAFQDARRLQEFTQLKVEAAKRLSSLYDESLNSPTFNRDPEGIKSNFDQQITQLNTELSSKIVDPRVKAHFDDFFGTHSITFAREMQNNARMKRLDIAKGSLLTALDELDTLAGRATSDDELASLVKTGVVTINDYAAMGVINHDDVPKLHKHFTGRVGSRLISRETRVDASSTLAKLLNGDYDRHLDETQKEKAIEKAQRQVDISLRQFDMLDRRQEAREEKERKFALDKNEMDLFARLAPDHPSRLTRQDLEDYREKRLIDANGYRALSSALEHDAGVDNKQILFDLESEIDSGQVNEDRAKHIRERVYNLTGKALSYKTAGNLLGKLRSVSREDDISKTPGYRDAHEFVKTQLTTTGPLEAVNQDDESRKAFALREFDQRARAGEDLWDVADDVVRRGKKAPITSPFYLRPRFLDGPTDDMAALDIAEKTTVERFKSGQLTPDLFKTEILAISEYRKAAQQKLESETTRKSGDSKIKRR